MDNDLKKGQSRFERRKVRINEAHKAARKQVGTGIGDEEGRRKHRLQENALQAERLRDADRAKATSTRDAFQLKLAQSRDEKFLRLETAARKAFGGYGRFRWLLSPDRSWPEPDLSPNENQVFAELERLHDKIEKDLQSFRRFFLPAVFPFLRVWLFVVLLLVAWAGSPAGLQRFRGSAGLSRGAALAAGVRAGRLF